MARKKGADKRRHPRISSRVPVRSGDPADRLEMESLNLSLEGVYCTASRYLPVMTKLRVTLQLPPIAGPKSDADAEIEAEAVVVRIDPGEDADAGKYNVALFFSKMGKEDRIRLAEYLDFEHKSRP
jgi:hypothetical protein